MRKDDIMELGAYFKSIIDQDRAAVVICSLDHKDHELPGSASGTGDRNVQRAVQRVTGKSNRLLL